MPLGYAPREVRVVDVPAGHSESAEPAVALSSGMQGPLHSPNFLGLSGWAREAWVVKK